MSPDDTTLAYIIDTQIAIFEAARLDLQLSIPEIARRSKLPVPTVNAWAQGRNALSLWGVKKLLRVKDLAPLLSRLFEPEEYALVAVLAGTDHDEFAAHCRLFLSEKDAAHHPDSEAGRDIGPTEDRRLAQTRLSVVGSVAA